MGGAEVGQARGEGGLSWFARCAAVGSAVPPRPSPSLFLHFRFRTQNMGNAHDQEGESAAKESGCRGWQWSLDRFVVAAVLAAVLAAWLAAQGLLSHGRGTVREERIVHGWWNEAGATPRFAAAKLAVLGGGRGEISRGGCHRGWRQKKREPKPPSFPPFLSFRTRPLHLLLAHHPGLDAFAECPSLQEVGWQSAECRGWR